MLRSCCFGLALVMSLWAPLMQVKSALAQDNLVQDNLAENNNGLFSQTRSLPGNQVMAQAADLPTPEPVQMNQPLTLQSDAFMALQEFLAEENWQAADQETRRILQSWVGDVYYGSPSNISVEVIQEIDRLWAEASGGRFGFRAQLDIWQTVRAQHPSDMEAAVNAFGDRVGWRRTTPDPNNFVSPHWFTEPELTYSSTAPVGHLPWAGVDWAMIEGLLNQQSCGSCTIDSMYLQGDRFTRYVPGLFTQVQTALAAPQSPDSQSWRTLRSKFEINLNSLYPNNRCPIETVDQAVSPNSQILAVSSYSLERACGGNSTNSTLVLWDAQRGNRIITLMRGNAVESFNYDGQPQEPPTEGDRKVGDVANAIAFTPDSQLIAAGLSNGTVRLWRTDTGQLVRTLSGHQYAVRAIAISADGTRLVSASSDQTIKLWDVQTGQLIRTMQLNDSAGIVHTVRISPDGRRLALATGHNLLQLRDLTTGSIVRTFVDETTNQPNWMPLAFSPDGRFLATSDIDHSVKLWNATTGARIMTLQGHRDAVRAIAFSPDSRTLASSSADYEVRLWSLQPFQLQRTLNAAPSIHQDYERPPSPGYLSFSGNGQILATSALHPFSHPISGEALTLLGITLWDAATGQSLTNLDYVKTFSFSPDSQFLLTNGHTLQVWRPHSQP
ncbi:MAG: GUN4 domain-containing protein [Leptolyngbyaceae bacterium]|nr:GUN4 domain-containing protein [Leptolyngbyaceae bacterium]